MGVAAPAQAAPVVTGGLVNVTIVDAVDISRVTVRLPVAVAANVCDVDVAIPAGGHPGHRHSQLHRHRRLASQQPLTGRAHRYRGASSGEAPL